MGVKRTVWLRCGPERGARGKGERAWHVGQDPGIVPAGSARGLLSAQRATPIVFGCAAPGSATGKLIAVNTRRSWVELLSSGHPAAETGEHAEKASMGRGGGCSLSEGAVYHATAETLFSTLPPHILAKILIESAPVGNLLLHLSVCARVHPLWREVALSSPAYSVQKPFRKEVIMPWVSAAIVPKREDVLSLNLGFTGWFENNPAYTDWGSWVRTTPTDLQASGGRGVAEGMVPLGDGGALALGAALQAMASPLPFEQIHLFKNFLTAEGLAPVMRAIRQRGCPQLTYLSVRHNPLGDAGISDLASALPPSVRELYVGRTDCGDKGMIALAASLPGTDITEFHCVDLPDVGPTGWSALGKVLPQLQSLRLLNLALNPGLNPISQTIGCHVSQAVRLWSLLLQDCKVDDDGVMSLGEVLPRCPQLRYVNLAGNNFTAEAERLLSDKLAPRPEVLLDL